MSTTLDAAPAAPATRERRAGLARVTAYVSPERKRQLLDLALRESAREGRRIVESELVDSLIGIALNIVGSDDSVEPITPTTPRTRATESEA